MKTRKTIGGCPYLFLFVHLFLYDSTRHEQAIRNALANSGLTPQQIQTIVNSNNSFDSSTQSTSDSYLHSMLAPRQNLRDAQKARQQFMDKKLKEIKDSRANRRKKGDKTCWSDEELKNFGELQHPPVDETCSSHAWQVWDLNAYIFNTNNYRTNHQQGDSTMSQEQLAETGRIIQQLFNEARN